MTQSTAGLLAERIEMLGGEATTMLETALVQKDVAREGSAWVVLVRWRGHLRYLRTEEDGQRFVTNIRAMKDSGY